MCVAHVQHCSCGARSVSLQFRDNILSEQVVAELYCPSCSQKPVIDQNTMLSDNGWIIVYNMDIAKFAGSKSIEHPITPAVLFDEGYCTWNGIYPGDTIDSVAERAKITSLAKTDPREYVKRLTSWGVDRMERLAGEGWRKAREGAVEKTAL
ncbi:MAG: hypothetical protein A2X56_01430 [Nitrospirae bacterium GWC2_57_13]|jgi:hypothetical protein|nr:MAG: hypothetical protein A2072_02315 [Nitrospirae bacterium GWC1_57_7]OGW27080.1 MAG: hypothetical protein A2X56_01430 [Nitrospirae bacterium GWC2_57_13]OGW45637.1 MAG: hypothetical protein A2X57_03150 [Nitrospirae bacterium GWD2_57_8]HAR44645.1 hypothetical protein [Nitrospiraceae bacterium]HAS54248.1 hypothetical protein [Nitrospiraceae bacterium]